MNFTRSYLFITILFILFAIGETKAQWTPAALSVDRCQLAAVTVGNRAFFAGGGKIDFAEASNDVDVYDNQTNSWSKAYLSAPRAELAAAAVGTKAFFAGGQDDAIPSDIVDIFDIAKGTWSVAKLSEARSQLCATSAGNKVFFAGGTKSGAPGKSDVVDIYDNSTNTWSQHKLSLARCWLAAASVGTKVLFAGGLDARSASSDVVDIYEISTNTWSQHKLSQARFDLAATTVGNKVLFAGGNTPLGESDVVDIYDYDTNSWSTYHLSQPRFDLSATTVGTKAIFAGGHYRSQAKNTTSNVVDIYDVSSNNWFTSMLSISRNSMGATAVGTKAIFAGGWSAETGQPVGDVNIYESDTSPPDIFLLYHNEGVLNSRGKFDATVVITDSSPIVSVVIESENRRIIPGDSLRFEMELSPGKEFRVIATDKFGLKNDRTLIVRQHSTDDRAGAASAITLTERKYYALLIAVEKYADPGIIPLSEPVKDATLLMNILTTKYSFDKNNTMFLKNPTSSDMSMAFDSLTRIITDQDFLLIFYAGHGAFDDKTKIGYWLLADASATNRARWYRNSALKEDIGAINSKHTILITDACFSGVIFKTRSLENNASTGINSLMKLPSRKAMTSGSLTTVPDKSIFMKYLLKYLQENQKQYLPSADLYYSIRMAITNNSTTMPEYGKIPDVGDEGGDFVFYQPGKP